MFPLVLSLLTDAIVGLVRVQKFLIADELVDPYTVDASAKHAVEVDGDFTWETAGKLNEKDKDEPDDPFRKALKKRDEKEKAKREKKEKKEALKSKRGVLPVTAETGTDEKDAKETAEAEKPFELKNLNLTIPRGSFTAIVGRVGSGKV